MKFLPSNPIDLKHSQVQWELIADLLKQMYISNQSEAYPPSLHIRRSTDIKLMPNRTYPRLPICDEGRKKGSKLYFSEEMPNKRQKVQITNYSRYWRTLFSNNKLVKELDNHDAYTSWNQTVWFDIMNVSTSNYVDWPIEDDHKDSIQLLHPMKVYHFDDVSACFMKNPKDGFIKHLLKLPIIFNHIIFDLNQMDEDEFSARIIHIFEELKLERAQWDKYIMAKIAANQAGKEAS